MLCNLIPKVEAKNVELARRNMFLEKLVSMQQEEIALLKSQLLLPIRRSDTGVFCNNDHPARYAVFVVL